MLRILLTTCCVLWDVSGSAATLRVIAVLCRPDTNGLHVSRVSDCLIEAGIPLLHLYKRRVGWPKPYMSMNYLRTSSDVGVCKIGRQQAVGLYGSAHHFV